MLSEPVLTDEKCHHCGEPCLSDTIAYDKHLFCCHGCKAVYQLINASDLQEFYQQRNMPEKGQFDFLNDASISSRFIKLKTDKYHKVQLLLPAIHCSSCLYVLERLPNVEEGIWQLTVNFSKKTADILFDPAVISLADVARLLASIGYTPDFSERKDQGTTDNSLALKIGVAGFCFGNIMLISFPEYLGISQDTDGLFVSLFGYISLVLSLPVMLYAGIDYLKAAWLGLKNRFINIEVPIALGMLVLFVRSAYEIMSHTGPGYLDSLAGLIFFLLVGRWFQSKTYDSLAFDRDYTSYFPLAVLRRNAAEECITPIQELNAGDTIIIRNNEIVPADATLLEPSAKVDYSFVTGEQDPVAVAEGDTIYAGGRIVGARTALKVLSKTSQSYLTALWNNQVFKDEKHDDTTVLTNRISKYFTAVILLIALAGAMYWLWHDSSQVWQVVSAVLIVACPCALALSAPFTNGNTIRILGRNGFYLKKATVAEQFSAIDTIIFDKTGTITESSNQQVTYVGDISDADRQAVKAMVANSTHPLSQLIGRQLADIQEDDLVSFEELGGKGLRGTTASGRYRLGSANWLEVGAATTINKTRVYLERDGLVIGYFEVGHRYRQGLSELLSQLSSRYELIILSGDSDGEKDHLARIFPKGSQFHFNQKPEDKLHFIEGLQARGRKVLMLGDGLNDAGALQQSDVGIAVTDDTSAFTPACDAILHGGSLVRLAAYITFAHRSRHLIYKNFTISFLYNGVGLSMALAGMLTPIFAAILMPLSSISVVLFSTISGNLLAGKMRL